MSTGTALLIAVLLLIGNAFFVGAEFAIMSARRSRVEPLAEQGSRAARTVLGAMENVTLMLACAQLGVTLCSTGLGVVAEPALAKLVEGPLVAVGLPVGASHVLGFTLALVLVVYLHVVVGEMVPKNLAVTSPERAALLLAPPLVLLSKVLHPIVAGLNWVANGILRLVGVEPKGEVASAFTAEEVGAIVERSRAEGVLQDDLGLLTGALEFSQETAARVMVPPASLVTLPLDCSPEAVEHEVARTGYSRFPLVDDDGDLAGYLHVKDVLYADGEARRRPVPGWRVRALASVAPEDEVEDALAAMQRSGAHLARVVRPGTKEVAGVVFLEDILEELVGEVRDSMQREQSRG
ncbi:hemolysin family protein [Georgenia yuyongxinii]|uniref:HlyC/CorC family transporter n=1 Tax=Georgenia yuyongxinii TaxID=2589797 RepID=A0A552WMC3_9MICO|nr:hemolysin family protein [Georgenia yuyongxinii]TRW43844.1 HlyC/CorC family transporter [Georgenia yuyongxinii]